LADSLNALGYIKPRADTSRPLDSIFINVIQYRGLKKVSANFLEGSLHIKPLSWVKLNDLDEGVMRAYGSGFFESVNYSFLPDGKGADLVIEVREGGQGIMGAGIHYDSDFNVALLLNATFKNVMIKGSKLFIDAGLGENPKASVYYLIDRGKKPGFGVRYTYLNLDFSDHDKGTVENLISTNDHKLEVFTQISLKNTTQFKAGIEYEYFKIRSNLYNPDEYNFNSYLNLFFSLAADSYNRSSFPTNGSHTEFKAKYVFSPKSDWLTDLLDNAFMFQLKHIENFPLNKRNTLRAGVAAGVTIKNKIPPFQHLFIVGGQNQNTVYDGFIPFTGLPFVEKNGMYVAVANFAWQYNFYRDFYLTPKVDIGYISTDIKTLFDSYQFMIGYGVCFGYDSFIGPVEFTLMGSNWTKGVRGFINIGYYF
jgi:NTE family protein